MTSLEIIGIIFAVILIFVGYFTISMKLVDAWFELRREAKENKKQIEFGLFIVAIFALVISIVSIIYTAFISDQLRTRVDTMEQQIIKMQSPTPTPSLPQSQPIKFVTPHPTLGGQ